MNIILAATKRVSWALSHPQSISAPELAGRAKALPRPLSYFGGRFSTGEGEGREGKEGRGKEGEDRGG